MLYYSCISCSILVGYGFILFSGLPLGSRPNNDLVRLNLFAGFTLRLSCRSNSTMQPVGELIGLDGTAIGDTDDFDIANALAGELSVFSDSASIPSNDQGVYTCRIPDSTNTIREVNFGIYNGGFSSELY